MTPRWAFVPSAPLLAVSGDEVVAEARAAALDAVAGLLAGCEGAMTVLADHREPTDLDESAGGDLRRYGLDVPAGGARTALGLGHTIGAWLLDRVGWGGERRYVTVLDELPSGPLLAVADGAGCVAASSPKGLDPRGPRFQDELLRALRSADTGWLAGLDLDLAAELWCSGAPVLQQVGRVGGKQVWDAEVTYSGAPLGVAYWVATWHPR